MSDDLYSILGVPRSASPEDIRKAYRKLAKDLHPDLHPGDKAAEDRFKTVSAAYAILENPEKRARYDRGEIDATGAEPPQHRYYREYADAGGARHYETFAGSEDFVDLSDILSGIFRRESGGPRRGIDFRYQLIVEFLDAVNGTTKRVTMPNGATLDVKIPPGVRDGQTLRLKGRGGPGADNGPAGDALVEIDVSPHPVFSREKDDIVIELPITIDEAVLGGKVDVPTISGRVSLSIPKGATSGQVLRLRGKGVKNRETSAHGDQLVRLRVAMPSIIDPDLEEFFKTWRESHPYDPRPAQMKG